MLFLTMGLPMMFFGLAMATDFVTLVVRGRQVSNAVLAANNAGGLQLQKDRANMDRSTARATIRESLALAEAMHAIPDDVDRASLSVGISSRTGGGFTITTTYKYTVDDLAVLPAVYALLGGEWSSDRYVVTRISHVCSSRNATSQNTGACQRPE